MLTAEEARKRHGGELPDSLLQQDFMYHPPCEECVSTIRSLTEKFISLARSLNKYIPNGRAKEHAIKHLEEAFQWAKTGVVRNHHRL